MNPPLHCVWPGCTNTATHREVLRGRIWGIDEPDQVFCPQHTKLKRREYGGSFYFRKLPPTPRLPLA